VSLNELSAADHPSSCSSPPSSRSSLQSGWSPPCWFGLFSDVVKGESLELVVNFWTAASRTACGQRGAPRNPCDGSFARTFHRSRGAARPDSATFASQCPRLELSARPGGRRRRTRQRWDEAFSRRVCSSAQELATHRHRTDMPRTSRSQRSWSGEL